MTDRISHNEAEAFFEALTSRDPARIEPFLAEDVDWLIVGPTELFSFAGQHFGKEAVLAAYSRMSARAATKQYVRDYLMTDGTCASALTRLIETDRATGREIILRLAQFARFQDGKAIEFCSMIDTLGAVEQVLGHSITLAPEPAAEPASLKA